MQMLQPYAPTLSPTSAAPRILHDNECNDMMESPTTPSSTSMPSSATTRLFGEIQSGDRECVLFPTYAMRNPQGNNKVTAERNDHHQYCPIQSADDTFVGVIDPSEWLIRTKGWALSHNISPAKQRIAMGKQYNSVFLVARVAYGNYGTLRLIIELNL